MKTPHGQAPKDPPIFEDPALSTTFATEVSMIGAREGVITLVFAEERATNQTPPRMERRVVARVALPASGVEKMMRSLAQMSAAAAGNVKTAGSA